MKSDSWAKTPGPSSGSEVFCYAASWLPPTGSWRVTCTCSRGVVGRYLGLGVSRLCVQCAPLKHTPQGFCRTTSLRCRFPASQELVVSGALHVGCYVENVKWKPSSVSGHDEHQVTRELLESDRSEGEVPHTQGTSSGVPAWCPAGSSIFTAARLLGLPPMCPQLSWVKATHLAPSEPPPASWNVPPAQIAGSPGSPLPSPSTPSHF